MCTPYIHHTLADLAHLTASQPMQHLHPHLHSRTAPKHSIKQLSNHPLMPPHTPPSPHIPPFPHISRSPHLVEQLVTLLEAVQELLVSTEGDDSRVLVGVVHHFPPHALHRLVPLALHRKLTVDVLRAKDGLKVEPGALARHPVQSGKGGRTFSHTYTQSS